LTRPSYGDEPLSWRDDVPTAGAVNAQPIAITVQPKNTPAAMKGTTNLTVEVTGSEPQYQWFFKNKPVGSNSPVLTITNISKKNAGIYYCVISNAANQVVTANALVSAIIPVSIKMQPKSHSAVDGAKRTVFKVKALGTKPLQYQWYFNDSAITGATNATLILAPVQTNQMGGYWATASNILNGAQSATGQLTVVTK
jgi:hypothetical protein